MPRGPAPVVKVLRCKNFNGAVKSTIWWLKGEKRGFLPFLFGNEPTLHFLYSFTITKNTTSINIKKTQNE